MLVFIKMHALQVRDTRQNSESSRSHQVVRIHIESRPVQGHAGKVPCINTRQLAVKLTVRQTQIPVGGLK